MARKVLRHQWDVEYGWEFPMSHSGRRVKNMACRSCGITGHKSYLEDIRPCLGAPHLPECSHQFGFKKHCLTQCRCPGPGAVNDEDQQAARGE